MHSQKLVVTKRHTQQSLLLRGHKSPKTRIVILHLSPLVFEVVIGADDLTLQARFDGDVFGMASLSRPSSVCLRFELLFFFAFWVTVKGGWNMKQKLQV